LFHLSLSNGVYAEAREINGEFIVLKNSRAKKEDGRSLRQTQKAQRDQLRLDGKLLEEEQGNFLVFTEDVPFPSPSAAASMVIGAQSNGFISWKVKEGTQTYKDWLQNQMKNSSPGD
jgi:predicted type IV restriction endonuclease